VGEYLIMKPKTRALKTLKPEPQHTITVQPVPINLTLNVLLPLSDYADLLVKSFLCTLIALVALAAWLG